MKFKIGDNVRIKELTMLDLAVSNLKVGDSGIIKGYGMDSYYVEFENKLFNPKSAGLIGINYLMFEKQLELMPNDKIEVGDFVEVTRVTEIDRIDTTLKVGDIGVVTRFIGTSSVLPVVSFTDVKFKIKSTFLEQEGYLLDINQIKKVKY